MTDKVRSARRAAYQRTFCGDGTTPHVSAQRVLADLRRFANIEGSGLVVSPVSKMTDPFASMYRAGARDVVLRILMHLGIDEAQAFPTEETRDEQAIS
jgi:hypothetical protein